MNTEIPFLVSVLIGIVGGLCLTFMKQKKSKVIGFAVLLVVLGVWFYIPSLSNLVPDWMLKLIV